MKDFWKELTGPIYALAPMADVTDPAFRRLVAEIQPPTVMWTEFVSADGLYHTREMKKMKDEDNPLVRDLGLCEAERPVVAQLFGSNPETMEYAAAFALEKGFDGVDINMGCPDRAIERQGAGASHIKDPEKAKAVIRAALKGVAGKIPVSVKTRIGYNTIEYKQWFPHILSENISALTVHLRTRKEMSKVPAHWELAKEIVEFCKELRPDVKILGNGDVQSIQEAKEKIESTGVDGVMLGRAIFGNPYLFAHQDTLPSQKERLAAYLRLIAYFGELTPAKHMAVLKKHLKAFVVASEGANELRKRCYDTTTLEELAHCVQEAHDSL
jgi:nifR3 family TIM-barrel protein